MSKVINWTQYFMGVAKLSAFRSKDPNTQVGACIVNEANKIVGVGYNGLPWGCEDNAILNSTGQLKGCRIYVSLFPCHECVKAIIQSGISEIVYEDDKYKGTDSDRAAKRMLDAAGVKYTKVEPFVIEVK